MQVTIIPLVIGAFGTVTKGLLKGLGNKRTCGDYPNDSIVKIGQIADGDTNCNCCTRYSHQRIDKGSEGLGNKRTCGDHPNDSIVKIGHNTKKSPGDLKRLALGKHHQLKLM